MIRKTKSRPLLYSLIVGGAVALTLLLFGALEMSHATAARAPTAAELEVTPDTLAFTATPSNLTPPGQPITITNAGGGLAPMIWAVTKDAEWLTLEGSEAGLLLPGVSHMVTATVDATDLQDGEYTGHITVTATNVSSQPVTGSPHVITITLQVGEHPILEIWPPTLDFDVQPSTSLSVLKDVRISNVGQKPLTWTATARHNWLHIEPLSGTLGTQEIMTAHVGVDPTDFVPREVYSNLLTINAPGALNSPQVITISAVTDILQGGALDVSPRRLTFQAIQGGRRPSPQALIASNSYTDPSIMGWGAWEDSPWLSLHPHLGYLLSGQSVPLYNYVDTSRLRTGTYTASYLVVGEPEKNVANTPQRVTVTLKMLPYAPCPAGKTPPTITDLSPAYGYNLAAQTVVITGANFTGDVRASLEGYPLDNVQRVSATRLEAHVPAGLAPGTYHLHVISGNDCGTELLRAFTVLDPAPPRITRITPQSGVQDRVTTIDIYGSNFAPAITVTLDNNLALADLVFIDTTHLRGAIPISLSQQAYTLTIAPTLNNHPVPTLTTVLTHAYQVVDSANADDLWATPKDIWLYPTAMRAGADDAGLGLSVRRTGGRSELTDVEVAFYAGALSQDNLIATGSVPVLAPAGQGLSSTQKVSWTPQGAGEVTLYAHIDPADKVTEFNEDNNIISRTVTVLEPADDEIAPHVDDFTIAHGAAETTARQVLLNTSASDTGGSGIAQLYFVEYEYIASAGTWAPVQTSDWLAYDVARTDFAWALIPDAGVHYLQAWAADGDGNISRFPHFQYINYLPPTEHVARNDVQIYRQALNPDQELYVEVTPITGDPDLYIWPPDWEQGNPPWVSNISGNDIDALTVPISQTISGTYQIEIYGYTRAEYELEIEARAPTHAPLAVRGGLDDSKTPRDQPAIQPDSAPPNTTGLPAANVIEDPQPSFPPVTLTGPIAGQLRQPYIFTATLQAVTAPIPLTYTWQATDFTPHVTSSSALTAAHTFSWTKAGLKAITVTLSNAEGQSQDTHTITITPANKIYLPLVIKNSYNATRRNRR